MIKMRDGKSPLWLTLTMERTRKGIEEIRKAVTESDGYRQMVESVMAILIRSPLTLSLLFFFLILAFYLTAAFFDYITLDPSAERANLVMDAHLNCSAHSYTGTCPGLSYEYYPRDRDRDLDLAPPDTCPHYFNWIYQDLKPWAHTGISKEMIQRARRTANFRLVTLNGRIYVERYEKAFQSRDTFTFWGFIQLLRTYPGKLPDVDLMFDCVDWPVVLSKYYSGGENATSPPPLFRYCADNATLDIVFPDWSFWGWPEINIKPWDDLLEELGEGNRKSKWVDREPFAYWKGNPNVSDNRQDLLNCNVSKKRDWNARIFAQDWIGESRRGFKQSNLPDQCKYRYKIYIEGSAWSVSEKYILACDSVTLLIKPRYYDFFTRSLMPLYHYWPVHDNRTCQSLKFAVEWGNMHATKAQELGKAASRFIQDDLKMEYVYDYMFHVLSEYSKLLTFKPTVPENAVELCMEKMACRSRGLTRKFMMESLVKRPAMRSPCIMPAYDPDYLHQFDLRKETTISKVESWEEKKYGRKRNSTINQ